MSIKYVVIHLVLFYVLYIIIMKINQSAESIETPPPPPTVIFKYKIKTPKLKM